MSVGPGDEHYRRIADLCRTGSLTQREMAQAYGVAPTTVARWVRVCRDRGLLPRPCEGAPRPTRPPDAALRQANTNEGNGMSIEFASPAAGGGDSLTPSDVEGHVLIVEPAEYVPSIQTAYGEKDAIRVTVHDITTQSSHDNVLWFPGALIGALKPRIGQRVLGVMTRGQAKPGQAAPWVLQDASGNASAVQAATAYLTGQVAASMAAPAPAPATPASALDAALGNLAAAGLVK